MGGKKQNKDTNKKKNNQETPFRSISKSKSTFSEWSSRLEYS